MSKIRIFALGGLGENGKNMYVVDVDKQYFILDAGIKYPTSDLHGVDEIIPNYKMLLPIKDRIKGFFMSHAHEDHIGALPHMIDELNIPIYATNFTTQIIKDNFKDRNLNLEDYTFNTISQDSVIKFGNVKVTFFNTTHSIPESVGIALHTLEGVIVYTSDYSFIQQSDHKYQTDFRKINELANKQVLALLPESIGSGLTQDSGVSQQLIHKINSVYANAEGRIIVSLFSSDLLKIQRVIDISLAHKKRIAIIGRRAQRIVDIAIKNGYLSIPEESLVNLRYVDEKNKNDQNDLVALVTGNRHEPFYMLQRMCKRVDRLIHINENDSVLLLTSPVPGTEKMAARTLDVLSRSDANVTAIDKRLLSSSHASGEEIKMMINLLRPKYIIPTIGEYRHQYGVRVLAKELGYDESNVFLLDNGDSFNHVKGKDAYVSKADIPNAGDILIDGTPVIDSNDQVMRDRELLSADGVIMVVANISPRTKKVLGEPEIVSKGFVYIKEAEELLDKVKEIFHETSKQYLNQKYINWNEYKQGLRENISKYLFQETKRRPIMIPVLISTEV